MRFPIKIRHRRQQAVIYGKSKAYAFYRVAWRAGGKRLLKTFRTYSEAKTAAEAKVRELADGHQSAALSVKEAADALAIRDALDAFRRDTGRTFSAIHAVSQYLDAARKLGERPLSEAVDGFLANVATVKPKPLADAVEAFIASRAGKGESRNGKRSALNAKYISNTANWLRELAGTLPGHRVSDLTKEMLALHMDQFENVGAKSRNDRRATITMFLRWAVRNDFLPPTTRLLEADALRREQADHSEIEFYRPKELRALLDKAERPMQAIIALQALAGLRMDEALRLDWRDVFGIAGHVEVTGAKSKTRARRLVVICPALEQWLAPFRGQTGRVAARWATTDAYVSAFIALRKAAKVPARRNGLRRGFVTYHFALHSNENLTAALAGNSPRMIHHHYRGLATKVEAEKWFAVAPAKADNVIALERTVAS